MGTEYFVVVNTFATPFISETYTKFIEGESPAQALLEYCEKVRPYSANVYWDANDYHKGKEPVARYLCNKEIAKQEAAKGLNSFTYESKHEDSFIMDGVEHFVNNPRDGRLV